MLCTAILALVCANVSYAVETGTDEISAAILAEGSLPVTWENDETYPWTIEDGWMKSGNVNVRNSSSSIAFSYTSENQTEVTFNWWTNEYNYSSHWVRLWVDGTFKGETTTSNQNQVRFYLPKGSHVVEIVDSIGNSSNNSRYAGLRNVKVREIVGLEDALLTAKSLPITFQNDEVFPWTPENGYVQNSNYNEAKSSSKLTATVSIDKPSKLSFQRRVSEKTTNHWLQFFINGEVYNGTSADTDWGYVSVVLQPGEYTLEWLDTYESQYGGYNYWSQIRNVELRNDWVEVDVTPGTLGVEVLYKVDVLKDVQLLKIRGTINSTDWATIKQMTNIHAIDFSEAKFNAVPANAFNGLRSLSTVTLPEGVTSIGEAAFRNTDIFYLTIPATVKSIGKEAFYQTRLRTIDFAPESQLQTIGYAAFYQCVYLREFIMPNSVTTLERHDNDPSRSSNTFHNCTSLAKVSLSDGLTTLPKYTFYNANLTDLKLPSNLRTIEEYCFNNNKNLTKVVLPETLRTIGDEAFGYCGLDTLKLPLKLASLGYNAFEYNTNLKKVELPSNISEYNNTFYMATGVKTVVCPSATPPTIKNDPFYGPAKGTMTLVVPSFAVVNYKLDSYWYQFGNITEGDEIGYWNISGELSLVNNRRMEGTPDVDLTYGGRLTVSGNAPMTVGDFNIYISEGNPSRLLNSCNAFTAESINTHFYVDANRWYFLTPMADVNLQDVTVSNTSSFVFRYYDGANRAATGTGSSWKNVTDAKLKAGQGYIFQCNAASVITFPVATELHEQILSPEAVTIPLVSHASDNAANKGWNYVGNPYPCYYDIFYMDFTAPITLWTGSTYRAYSIADDDCVLRPMQGFFVQKPDAVDAIIMQTEGKQISPTVNRASYAPTKAAATANRFLFNVEISTDTVCDMTRVVLNEEAALGYEIERDATKFMSFDADVAQIYTVDNEENRLSINERPEDMGEVKLGVYVPRASMSLTISAARKDGEIYLYDTVEEKTVNLSEQDYVFASAETGNIDNRFTLRLKPAPVSDIYGVDSSDAAAGVIGGNGMIEVTSSIDSLITVYGIDGKIYSRMVSDAGATMIELPAGMYIVDVAGKSFKAVVR